MGKNDGKKGRARATRSAGGRGKIHSRRPRGLPEVEESAARSEKNGCLTIGPFEAAGTGGRGIHPSGEIPETLSADRMAHRRMECGSDERTSGRDARASFE